MERHPHTQPHALFIALWRRHVARVRFICLRAAHGNTAVAKDLVQDVAIHLLHACDTITPENPIKSERRWVACMARTAIGRSLRGDRPTVSLDSQPDMAEPQDWQLRETIEDLAQNLDDGDQAMLHLRLDGYTNEEIALVLGLTHIAVRSRMHRIIQQMRLQADALGYNDTNRTKNNKHDRERD